MTLIGKRDMVGRLLYAPRTLFGPWLMIPAAALETANLYQRGMPWRGEGMWTVEWFAISLFIIGPMCAGVAAVDAARLSQPGNIHLVLAVPHPTRVYLRAAGWCAVPLAVLHLLFIGAGLVIGQVQRPSVGWWSLAGAAIIQCGVIFWYAAVGSAIGRFASPVLAGMIAGIGSFVLSYQIGDAASGQRFQLLALGAATVSRIGIRYNGAYLIGQSVLLVGTAALFLFLTPRLRSGWRLPSAGGLLAAGAAIALIVAAPGVLPASRTLISAPKAPTFCSGGGPRICLYYEHRRYAQLVDTDVRTLTLVARRNGYDALVPREVVENSRAYQAGGSGVDSLWLATDAYEDGDMSLEDTASQLIVPAQCPALHSLTPPSALYDSRYFSVLATWLSLAHVTVDHDWPAPTRILRPAEVATILGEFQRCDLDG